ncbi:cupin domain-containing protein, partial [Pseudomonas neuropathica]
MNLRNTTGLLAIAASLAFTAFAGVSQAQESKAPAEASQASQPAKSWQTGIHRTDLLKRDLDVSGREVIQVLVDIDPGVSSPK